MSEVKVADDELFGAAAPVYYALVGTAPDYTLYFSSSDITTDPKGTGATVESHGLVNTFSSESNRPWDSACWDITQVEILDTIYPESTAYWFYDNRYVDFITGLDQIDTSNVTNMSNMFVGCELVTSLDVSKFNTSNVTDMSYMFDGCLSLTSLDVSNFNTSNVANMECMFSELSLTRIDVSSLDTRNVTTMVGMFADCTALTTLDLSNFDTSRVTDMEEMFSRCDNLKHVDVSSFDTSNVTNMRQMFNRSGFTVLDLSSFDTSHVTNMTSMFRSCGALTAIKVDGTKFITSQVTDSIDMFAGSTAIRGGQGTTYDNSKGIEYARIDGGPTSSTPGYFTDVLEWTLPKTWIQFLSTSQGIDYDSSVLNITFEKYPAAAPIAPVSQGTIPNSNGLELYATTNAVDNSKYDITFYAPADGTIYAPSYSEGLFNDDRVNIVESINNLNYLDTSRATDIEFMFGGCEELTSLDLSGFDTSNVTNMKQVFYACKKLTSLDLSSFDTSNVTTMDGMFHTCPELTSIDLHSFDTHNVTNMEAMFMECSKLASLDLSHFDTSNTTGGMFLMFADCRSLTSLDLSNFDTHNITDMHSMFNNCEALENLNISSFDTSNVTVMQTMFYNCKALISLDVSSFNTSNVNNMIGMFAFMDGLTTLDVSNFDTSNVTSMQGMFYGCSALTSLDLSNFDTSSVTDIKWIFRESPNLTLVKVDSTKFVITPTTDSADMFTDCTALIGYEGTVYDSTHTDATYAILDDADNGNPGYFSEFPRIFIYDGDDGSYITRVDYQMSDLGNNVTEPTRPTKANMYFGGWYLDDSLTNEFVFTRDTLPGNMFLYVKWSTTPAPKRVSSFTINTPYPKATYSEGDKFDPTGLVVNVTYDDGTTGQLTYADNPDKFSFTPSASTPLTTTDTKVTITIDVATVDLPVTVSGESPSPPTPPTPTPPTPSEITVKSIEVETKPTKTTYVAGDYIDPTGLVIKVIYDDDTTGTITYNDTTKNNFKFKPELNTPLTTNDNEVVITYGDKPTSVSITVDKKSDPIPYYPSGGTGKKSSGGKDSSSPTRGPMGDLTKNPAYAYLTDPLAVATTQPEQQLNTTNDLPQEDLIYDLQLANILKSFEKNSNPTRTNVSDVSGNKGYGEWLNIPQTTTWYFLTGNLKPEDIGKTGETGGFLRSGWYSLGWRDQTDWYHFNTSGTMDMGWYQEGNKTYYLEPDINNGYYGRAVTGTQVIDGVTYNFDATGALIN